jgi:hypothetical protein
MAGDCTHHDHKMDLLVVVKHILEPTTLVFDWNSKCYGHPLVFGMWGWKRYIARLLSLGYFLSAGRAGPLQYYEDQLPFPLQRRSNCPVRHILGWRDMLAPARYKSVGIGNHCHILPVGLPRSRVMGILRLHLVRPLWVHNIVETGGWWKHGTPLEVC